MINLTFSQKKRPGAFFRRFARRPWTNRREWFHQRKTVRTYEDAVSGVPE